MIPHLSSYQTEKNVISLPNRLFWLPLLREPGFLCRRWNVASVRRSRPARGFNFSASFWRGACNFLDRPCDATQRCTEIGDIDHGKQQSRYPEQVNVREERQQAQNGHDLELQLL